MSGPVCRGAWALNSACGRCDRCLETAPAEIARLKLLINTPETDDWFKGVKIEAAHQIERWGSAHDAGKSALDWFWLIGYLAQKVVVALFAEDPVKAKHHTISTAAAMLNWHRAITGENTKMRPGIEEPK